MDRLFDMPDSNDCYFRIRELALIAYNAKWDKDNLVDEWIDKYLKHIMDTKPIAARECIKLLPIIAQYKPDLKEEIVKALNKADVSIYADSMQGLIFKDIQNTLKTITSKPYNGK